MLGIIFALVMLTGAGAITKQDCPDTIPKDRWTQVYGNVCYRFDLDIRKEYDDAQEHCRRRGGNLVTIKSREINNFIANELSNRFHARDVMAWIGLNDIDDEQNFFWVDGTPMQYSNFVGHTFIYYLFGHYIEDCAAIDSDGKWHDFTCSDYSVFKNEHKSFICEYKVDVVPETTPDLSTQSPPKTTTKTVATATTSATTRTLPTATTVITTTTTSTPTTTCPELICELDCGMDGFKTDETSGCTMCKCNVIEDI